ncbi:hypothetical protein [Streptomyces ipomoeae]|uniref:hypothetical protein n=1 Tax=Streptomyces ipomoeae TaxID=103232 RepID=UPI001FD3349C|nr:hypothetical protein [Streptomyces ipomoeae]MDX2936939.1 hypothetical protein [Streptomyces ipomoeae]
MGSLRLTLCTGAVAAVALTVSAPAACTADSGDVSVVPTEPTPGSDIQVRARGCEGKQGTAASKAFVADAQLTVLGGRSVGTLAGETRVRSTLAPGTYEVRVSCDGKEDKVKGTIKVGDGKSSTARPSPSRPPFAEPFPVKPPPSKPSPSKLSPYQHSFARLLPSRSADAPPAAPPPTAPASPIAPVRAGGGGAAAQPAANPTDLADSGDLTGLADAMDAMDTADSDAARDGTTSRDSADPANSMDDARHTGPGTSHTVVGLVLASVAAVAVVARSARRGRRGK